MNFREFLHAYRTDTLHRDAAWRAYDIEGAHIQRSHIRGALKSLRLSYAGELAIPEFQARYGIATREEAINLLGWWWLWAGLAGGRRMGVALRATTLAGGQESGHRPPPSPPLGASSRQVR